MHNATLLAVCLSSNCATCRVAAALLDLPAEARAAVQRFSSGIFDALSNQLGIQRSQNVRSGRLPSLSRVGVARTCRPLYARLVARGVSHSRAHLISALSGDLHAALI